MGWIQELYNTYKISTELIGREDNRGCILLPIGHSTQNAQLEIVIDLNGDFQSGRIVEKAENVTIIPVTEDSGSRSNGIAPHPLFDKLCYIAGDYARYVSKKNAEEYYTAYLKQLELWVIEGCHPYVKAIYDYIKKGTIIKNLIDVEVLLLDDEGMLAEDVKVEGIAQPDCFVRFRIQDELVLGRGEVWRKREVYDDYIKFYLGQVKKVDLDYISGEWIPCSEKQPSKIRNSGDKAKLISANDSSGFTYRGRFGSREEALSIGYVPSQGAHNALKWLIERQAYRRFGMCIVSWNPKNEEVVNWMDEEVSDLAYTGMLLESPDVGEHYALRLRKAILGRYGVFRNPGSEIVILALDAATPGRLSVTYYQKLLGSEFLDNLIYWHTTAAWNMWDIRKRGTFFMAPKPEDIVKVALGNERNNFLVVDDKLMKDTLQRLISCITERKKLPTELVNGAVANVSRPMGFSHYNRRKILEITCAMICKTYHDKGREVGNIMGLNRENRDRDYLFGRLLAVAQKLEFDTFTKEEREKRETNATRFTSMFVKNPGKTWEDINIRLDSYRKKLSYNLQVRYAKELQEIHMLFLDGDFSKPQRLGVEYVLGYYCEQSELWNSYKLTESTGGNEDE